MLYYVQTCELFLSGVTGSIGVDGKPAGKKTTTAPIIVDGRSSKCNNCRILPVNRKLYYIHEDFSPDIRILSPPHTSSVIT